MGRCHRRTCERWPPTPVGLELGPFKDRPARATPTYAAETTASTATPLNAACGSTLSRDRCRPRATRSPAPSVSGVRDRHPVHPWGTFDPMVPFRGGARVDMEAMQMSILVAYASKHGATKEMAERISES